ncbi:MAG: HAMP domain-containing sensor histidine kinase [Acidimicrobiia bacterium]
MRRRILTAMLGVTAVAILLFGVPLAVVFERLENEGAALRLERQAIAASRAVPGDFGETSDPVEFPPTADGVTFGLYDKSGSLVAGDGPASADATTIRALRNEIADLETPTLRVASVPIAANEVVVGAVRAEQSNVAGEAQTAGVLVTMGAIALLVLAVGASIGYLVAGRLARPVRLLRDAAVQLGNGDFMIDVPRSKVVELDEAAVAMTATAHRLDDLVTKERMFSSDVSHQLRTPVAGLRAAIETELEYPRADSSDVLREALVDLDRLESTIGELLAVARTSTTDDTAVDLLGLLNQVETRWQKRFTRAGRTLAVSPARFLPPVSANGAMLGHVLDVLIENALEHGAGEVLLTNAVGDDSVTLIITDEGEGFESGQAMSRDTAGSSTQAKGLGIPLAKRLVEAMGGRLSINQPGPNPRVDVVLRRLD